MKNFAKLNAVNFDVRAFVRNDCEKSMMVHRLSFFNLRFNSIELRQMGVGGILLKRNNPNVLALPFLHSSNCSNSMEVYWRRTHPAIIHKH